jgi:hypothetical protein
VPRAEKRTRGSTSKRLVVDASILHAAGQEGSTHPNGSKCRDALILIREGGHAAAITDDIIEEWNRHSSRFARTWRIAMNARHKTLRVRPADCSDVLAALHQSRQLSQLEVAAAEKDMHLVAAARAADRAILSLDELTRSILRKIARLRRRHARSTISIGLIPRTSSSHCTPGWQMENLPRRCGALPPLPTPNPPHAVLSAAPPEETSHDP